MEVCYWSLTLAKPEANSATVLQYRSADPQRTTVSELRIQSAVWTGIGPRTIINNLKTARSNFTLSTKEQTAR